MKFTHKPYYSKDQHRKSIFYDDNVFRNTFSKKRI